MFSNSLLRFNLLIGCLKQYLEEKLSSNIYSKKMSKTRKYYQIILSNTANSVLEIEYVSGVNYVIL